MRPSTGATASPTRPRVAADRLNAGRVRRRAAHRVASLLLVIGATIGVVIGAIGCGGPAPVDDARQVRGGYDLASTESELARLEREAGDDGRTARELARRRGELFVYAQLVHDRALVETLAKSYGGAVAEVCAGEGQDAGEVSSPAGGSARSSMRHNASGESSRGVAGAPSRLDAACIPSLASRIAGELRAQAEAPALAELLSAVADGFRGADVGFVPALARHLKDPEGASVAAAALTWSLGFIIVDAVGRAPPALRPRLLAEGVGLECPRVLPILSSLPPEDRGRRLAAADCLPVCRKARRLIDRQPRTVTAVAARRCDPSSLGVETAHGRDVVAFNLTAWAAARGLHWLARARNVLEGAAAESRLAATVAERGVLGAMDEGLARLRFVVPFPGSLAWTDDAVTLPALPAQAPWLPSPLFALVRGEALYVGASPWLDPSPRGVYVRGTPFPGRRLAADERTLKLSGEPTVLTEALSQVAADALPEPAGGTPSLVILADETEEAARVIRVAARIEGEAGYDVRLGVLTPGAMATVPVGVAQPGQGRAENRLVLSLTADGHRLSGIHGPVDVPAPPGSDLSHELGEARRRVGAEALQVTASPSVSYRRFLDVLAAAVGGSEPPFDTIRLAPLGLEP